MQLGSGVERSVARRQSGARATRRSSGVALGLAGRVRLGGAAERGARTREARQICGARSSALRGTAGGGGA